MYSVHRTQLPQQTLHSNNYTAHCIVHICCTLVAQTKATTSVGAHPSQVPNPPAFGTWRSKPWSLLTIHATNSFWCCRAHKRICCSLAWLPILLLFILIVALLVRTFTVSERCVVHSAAKLGKKPFHVTRFQLAKLSEEKPVFLNPDNATKLLWAAILGKAIQFPTVSR